MVMPVVLILVVMIVMSVLVIVVMLVPIVVMPVILVFMTLVVFVPRIRSAAMLFRDPVVMLYPQSRTGGLGCLKVEQNMIFKEVFLLRHTHHR